MKLIEHNAPIRMASFSSPKEASPFEVSVCLDGNRLRLEYFVAGVWRGGLNAQSPRFERRHGLWEQSCLELFWGKLKTSVYWEYNFSLDGCWNCYRFSGYRRGMTEETDIALHRFVSGPSGAGWGVDISVTLPAAALAECAFSPSAVWTLSGAGEKHFFAPFHLDDKPDFHRKAARRFLIRPAAQRT